MSSCKFSKGIALLFTIIFSCFSITLLAQSPVHYEPTITSLNQHPLPQWYSDAKLGIFVVWGAYSVPGWAPITHPNHNFTEKDYLLNNPYAEWYYNSMRLDGSPTQAYHRKHYGADYNYYNFTSVFDRESQKWNPDKWAQLFHDTGAKYVVLTAKFHDGFLLWPSTIPNPNVPANRQHTTHNIVGELTTAVRSKGMRMGLYYSGGYDWTFVPGPISDRASFQSVKPQSAAYGAYADAQIRELIKDYKPAVLWNDIDWPKSGQPLQDMADYYNTVPDGVIDDRFGVSHSDFITPEYSTLKQISAKKWEECRGLGRSFGYNRAEGEAETIAPDKLIYLLVDIVSKNGNLLLDVGPEADGTIPKVQLERLHALGKWLSQNGDAIYGTHPWKRAEGNTAETIPVRFTTKKSNLYAILLGEPKTDSVTLLSLTPKSGTTVSLLGYAKPLSWSQQGDNVKVRLPHTLPGQYAYVLRMTVQ